MYQLIDAYKRPLLRAIPTSKHPTFISTHLLAGLSVISALDFQSFGNPSWPKLRGCVPRGSYIGVLATVSQKDSANSIDTIAIYFYTEDIETMRFRLSAASLCSALLVIAMADGPTAVDAAVVNVQLDMPPRLQWPQSGGYCGETSLQMSGLYFGAWISQFVAREKGGGDQEEGQLLLPYSSSDNIDEGGRNLFKAAVALGFSVNAFPSRQRQQSRKLLQWARKQLIAKKPVIYGIFVADCGGARDCDQVGVPSTEIMSRLVLR
jgi:hypothetical protein